MGRQQPNIGKQKPNVDKHRSAELTAEALTTGHRALQTENRSNWDLGVCVKCSPIEGDHFETGTPGLGGMETAWAIRASGI
jgi:hypothetical protein